MSQQLTQMVRQIESDLMSRVKESRDYQMGLWKQLEDDKSKEMRLGVDRTDDSAQMIKTVLA